MVHLQEMSAGDVCNCCGRTRADHTARRPGESFWVLCPGKQNSFASHAMYGFDPAPLDTFAADLAESCGASAGLLDANPRAVNLAGGPRQNCQMPKELHEGGGKCVPHNVPTYTPRGGLAAGLAGDAAAAQRWREANIRETFVPEVAEAIIAADHGPGPGLRGELAGGFEPVALDAASLPLHAPEPSIWAEARENYRRSAEAKLDATAGVVAGVGPDAPTVVNAKGGKQSRTPYRCDLLPPHALLAVAAVLDHGARKYGANNWHAIPVADHLNHALTHLYAEAAGDGSDDHLEHAATRILFALDQRRSGREGGDR